MLPRRTSGLRRMFVFIISSLLGSNVAVNAISGASGKRSFSSQSLSYDALKLPPHSHIRCASSMANNDILNSALWKSCNLLRIP